MAYGINVRERAFALFLMGQNPEQIADSLRQEYPTLSANTVRSWADDADDHGETWMDRRAAVDAAAKRRVEESAASERARARMRTSTLAEALYMELLSENAPKVKTREGGAHAFLAIENMAIRLEDENEERFSPFAAADALMDALNADPEVRKVLKARWPVVSKLIAAKMNLLTQTREIEVEAIESEVTQ